MADDTSTDGEGLQLARRLVETLETLRDRLPRREGELAARLEAHLGRSARGLPGVVERFHVSERVNIQVALDELETTRASWELIGLQADVSNFGGFSLTALIGDRFGHHFDEQPVEHVLLPAALDRRVPCFRAGLVLTEQAGTPIVLLLFEQEHGSAMVVVQIVSAAEGAAAAFLDELKTVMHEKNVFRGQTVSFSWGRHGEFGLDFVRVPRLERSDVILPEESLAAIEQHTLTMTNHSAALLEAGQHLRRGLLLFGPPGTGKTHTVSYLCNQLEGRTVLLLAGPALHAIGQAGTLARELAPSMVVIEDVDLIGMDRGLPGAENNPLLFQLLNEMDGIAEDTDVIFVLTTNRVDLLEPALAARPGRVDRAVEIGLPDAPARERLLRLYLRAESPDRAVLDAVVERTSGAPAALIKELARLSILTSTAEGITVDEALPRALDGIMEHATPVLRRILGLIDPDDERVADGQAPPPPPSGWRPAITFDL